MSPVCIAWRLSLSETCFIYKVWKAHFLRVDISDKNTYKFYSGHEVFVVFLWILSTASGFKEKTFNG